MNFDGPMPGIADASIVTVSALPERLAGAVAVGPHSQARRGALLRVVSGVARYLALDGQRVEVAPEPDADRQTVESYLLGGVRGALIHQRGELPLHASTVVSPGGATVSIVGISGTGKSTLAATLALRGWRLLADDLTRLTWQADHALAWPGPSHIKLMADACTRLGIATTGLPLVEQDPVKFQVTVPGCTQPQRLTAVLVITAESTIRARTRLTALHGPQALAAVTAHIFRPNYLHALGRAQECFALLAHTVAHCTVLQADRLHAADALVNDFS